MYSHFIQLNVDKLRGSRKAGSAVRTRRTDLGVEALEDRLVPAVFNVNSLADLLTPPPGAVTLRSAIQAASNTPGSNTINLTLPGTYRITSLGSSNETDNVAGELAYTGTGNLTIVNNSKGTVIVDGGGVNRVFDINSAAENTNPFTVAFQGIIITDGAASPGDSNQGSGGGIRALGAASVVLNNVIVTGNTATADGGGIALESLNNDSTCTLTLNASTISFDHAGDAGGGIETDGTGLVTINAGSVIDFNTCVNQGAGIWLNAGGASLNVTGAIISNNIALTMLAGGIGNAGAGNVTIANSLIQNNFAGGTGGGFGDAANVGNLTILNSTFLNNSAAGDGGGAQEGGLQVTIADSTFQGNRSGADGGGLFFNGSSAKISDTVFRQNVAIDGGAVEDQAGALTITTSTFDTNRVMGNNGGNANAAGTGGNGGAIGAVGTALTLRVNNSLFLNNSSSNGFVGNGGAISDNSGLLTVSNSQFTGNSTQFLGGAIYFAGNTFTIIGSTFNNNRAASSGGALTYQNTVTNGTASSLINDTFTANSASRVAAIELGGFGTVDFFNDTINGNVGSLSGGAISLDAFPLSAVFQNTIDFGNTAACANSDITSSIGNPIVADHGGNLIGVTNILAQFGAGTLTSNPLLGHLQNNGGQFAGAFSDQQIVQTEILMPGSPAIGTGVAGGGAPKTDERGFPRPAGGRTNPSIGAYEPQYATGATPNQILVENIFEVLLNRLADSSSASFVNELSHGVSAGTVALQIEGSGEYLGDHVQNLFERYLHRRIDSGSLPSFVNLLSHGSTLEQIAAIIVGSGEYFLLHGGNNIAFLNALYEDALGRAPDPLGQDSFTQMLAGGASRTAVALAVLTSSEYQANLVSQSFAQLLGRQAFPEDLTNFTNQMQKGLTDQALVAILIGSTEFLNGRA